MSDDLFNDSTEQDRKAEDFRAKLEEAVKREKDKDRELEKLRAKVAESDRVQREAQATSVFQESKLDPSWTPLFLKDNPDVAEIDATAVTEWAQRYNLAPKAPEPKVENEQVTDTPQPQVSQPPSFQPQVQNGSGAGVDVEISYEEYKAAVTSGDVAKHDWAIDLSQRGLVRR